MAKSVLDAGWSMLRTMLKYKSDDAGAWFKEINEAYSTQDGHLCGTRCGPSGLEGLAVRRWTCTGCGTEDDRDENAAQNTKQRGLEWFKKEFSAVATVKAVVAVNKDSGAPRAMVGLGREPLAEGIPSFARKLRPPGRGGGGRQTRSPPNFRAA